LWICAPPPSPEPALISPWLLGRCYLVLQENGKIGLIVLLRFAEILYDHCRVRR